MRTKGENILDVEKLSIYKDQAPKLAHDNALFIVYNIGDLDVAIEAASEVKITLKIEMVYRA